MNVELLTACQAPQLRPGGSGSVSQFRCQAGQFPQVNPLSPFSHGWVSGIVSSVRPRG